MGAPETSIESWARSEAQARLYLASEAGGGQTEFSFGTHYQELIKNEQVELWDKFNGKAMNPGEDDDDEDDDEDDEDDDDDEGEEVREIWSKPFRIVSRLHVLSFLFL